MHHSLRILVFALTIIFYLPTVSAVVPLPQLDSSRRAALADAAIASVLKHYKSKNFTFEYASRTNRSLVKVKLRTNVNDATNLSHNFEIFINFTDISDGLFILNGHQVNLLEKGSKLPKSKAALNNEIEHLLSRRNSVSKASPGTFRMFSLLLLGYSTTSHALGHLASLLVSPLAYAVTGFAQKSYDETQASTRRAGDVHGKLYDVVLENCMKLENSIVSYDSSKKDSAKIIKRDLTRLHLWLKHKPIRSMALNDSEIGARVEAVSSCIEMVHTQLASMVASGEIPAETLSGVDMRPIRPVNIARSTNGIRNHATPLETEVVWHDNGHVEFRRSTK